MGSRVPLLVFRLAIITSVACASACQQRAMVTERRMADSTGAQTPADPGFPAPDPSHDTPGLPPLSAEAGLIHLPLRGHYGPTTIAVPLGATQKRPVVVALHAHAIHAEHACTRWQRATHGWPFVLCPWGLPAGAKATQPVTLGSVDYTEQEVGAGLSALRDRFGAYLSDGPALIVGWSLGADVAVGLVGRQGRRYERVALGEGAYAEIDDLTARRLRAAGVRRVLLLCSTLPCETSYSRTSARLGRAGIESHVSGAGNGEHPFDGPAVGAAARAWPWLVAGDPRFEQE
jgi:pimeloyl-ACP methyl ester carboxylesterase